LSQAKIGASFFDRRSSTKNDAASPKVSANFSIAKLKSFAYIVIQFFKEAVPVRTCLG